jgi:hypothetical protein
MTSCHHPAQTSSKAERQAESMLPAGGRDPGETSAMQAQSIHDQQVFRASLGLLVKQE